MPIFQTLLGELNEQFSPSRIAEFAEKAPMYAPGKAMSAAIVAEAGTPLHRLFQGYLSKLPSAVHEAIRATIYHALTTSPPTQVTFAWAPGYDYEATVWQAPDTKTTKGGITVLIKSRYPDDKHPIDGAG